MVRISELDIHRAMWNDSQNTMCIKIRNPIRLSADFSAETLQARREWEDILKVMKEKNQEPRLLCPARISFRLDGETKIFTDKQI